MDNLVMVIQQVAYIIQQKLETYHNSDGNVINDFVKINQVNITFNFCGTFLDTKGNIYVTGINYYYQFGNGVSQSQQYNTPTKLDKYSNIISTNYGSYLEVTNLTPKYTSNSDTIGTVIIKYTSKYNHINSINNELKSIVIDPLLLDDNDRYIQFNYDSSIISYTIEFPEEYNNLNVDLLVVGGGGSGGYSSNLSGAGGGSVGGILHGSNLELHKNREYKITIGNGGLGGIDGEDSKFYLDDANFALARGGGKGGSYNSPPGQGGGGSGNYPEGGPITIYNSNIGDFSTLNSYQNKGNNADFTLIFTVLDFSGTYSTEDLHTNGTVSIMRFKFDDSERVIISSGNDNRNHSGLQPGIEASQHAFGWEDDYILSDQRDRYMSANTTWGMNLNYLIPTSYNYNLNGTTYNKHFYLCRTNTKIELTTIAFMTYDRAMKHFKIFGTNFDTSDITLDNIATNNWVELVEIDFSGMSYIVSFNKNNTFNFKNNKYSNVSNFHKYNWTDTTDRFNTFLFMVIDNNNDDSIKTLNIDEIAFRGKTMNGSIGGDGSSSDLIYHSLNFEGGIGKSNYHIISVTNADDNTGNGGSGNGGKGGSGTVIIKYIPKYDYKLQLENEITPVSLDEYHNYILFNINYDINNYKIKFPEEYGTFNVDVLVVSGNSLDDNGCNIGGGEVIYSNIELSSNIEYNINIGKNHIFKGFKSEFYNITAYGIQSNSNINIDTFGFINDNNLKITIDSNIYLENYSYEKYQTNDGISLYSIFPDSNLGYYNNSEIYFGISDYLGNVNNIPVNYSINKSMYVYGDNNYGQLGLGSGVDWQNTRTELNYFKDNNINIVKIFSHEDTSARNNNNFFIDNNGTVYACGYNSSGQLGIGSSDNKNIPTKISVFKNENNEEITKPIIIKIVNSQLATLFLDNNGNVYGCGKENLTFTEKLSHVNFKTYPTLLSPEINNIIDIAFRDYGFLLLNNNGIVYAIGENADQMGLGSNPTNKLFVNSITDHEIKVFLRKDKTEIIQRPYITKIYGHNKKVFL